MILIMKSYPNQKGRLQFSAGNATRVRMYACILISSALTSMPVATSTVPLILIAISIGSVNAQQDPMTEPVIGTAVCTGLAF